MTKPVWEECGGEDQGTLWRFPVPGGWLYSFLEDTMLTFVPDPEFYRHMDEEFQAMDERLKRKTES